MLTYLFHVDAVTVKPASYNAQKPCRTHRENLAPNKITLEETCVVENQDKNGKNPT